MWVKICANTCADDALKAAELGADAVGFVFAPSRRQVTAAQVASIVRQLPSHIERIGVFSDHSPETIAGIAEGANLTAVQLHAGFDREFTRHLVGRLDPDIAIIQTVHWQVGSDPKQSAIRAILAEIANHAPGRVLVDAKVGDATGGTGVAFDWASAVPVLSSQPTLQIILAGGLRPDNVADAIRVLNPWGVDVASGVEREPGHKDFAKLKAFMQNARGVV